MKRNEITVRFYATNQAGNAALKRATGSNCIFIKCSGSFTAANNLRDAVLGDCDHTIEYKKCEKSGNYTANFHISKDCAFAFNGDEVPAKFIEISASEYGEADPLVLPCEAVLWTASKMIKPYGLTEAKNALKSIHLLRYRFGLPCAAVPYGDPLF